MNVQQISIKIICLPEIKRQAGMFFITDWVANPVKPSDDGKMSGRNQTFGLR